MGTERPPNQPNAPAEQAATERICQEKTQFLIALSGAYKSALTRLIRETDNLLESGLSFDQRQLATVVKDSAHQLLSVTNDILDYSRVEAGELELASIDFDLRLLFDDIGDLYALKALEKGLEYVTLLEPKVPAWLRGDPGRLRQILNNLVHHGIQATRAGEIVVRVALLGEEGPECSLRFSVQVSDEGLSAEKLKRLSGVVEKKSDRLTLGEVASGLELVIAKKLIEKWGSELSCHREEGGGSTLEFTLSFAKQEGAAQKHNQWVMNQQGAQELVGKRILVVDDNAAGRLGLVQDLESFGCVAAQAASGFQALELLGEAVSRGEPYEIAVIDLTLTQAMDGEDLGRTIRQSNAFAGTMLMLVTAMGKIGDAKRYKDAGFFAYLTKPVKRAELYQALCSAKRSALPEEPNEAEKLVTKHSIAEAKKQNQRVLIVAEDAFAKDLIEMLSRLGYQSDAARDAQRALEAMDRTTYELVLLDLTAATTGGVQMVVALRRRGISREKLPVLALTGMASSAEQERFIQAGINDCLPKPITREKLQGALTRWLQREPPAT